MYTQLNELMYVGIKPKCRRPQPQVLHEVNVYAPTSAFLPLVGQSPREGKWDFGFMIYLAFGIWNLEFAEGPSTEG